MIKKSIVNELIATVPYAHGDAIEYYEDSIVFCSKQIYYEDITGYGYLLRNESVSVLYFPILNSRQITLAFSTGNDTKPTSFTRVITNFMLFHTQRQNELDIVFSEAVKITEALIAPKFMRI